MVYCIITKTVPTLLLFLCIIVCGESKTLHIDDETTHKMMQKWMMQDSTLGARCNNQPNLGSIMT